MLRFPSFEPDRTDYALDATTMLVNALPVRDGWGPVPDIQAVSDALGAECLSAVYAKNSAGVYRLIAGTTTALYELQTDYSWEDVSGSSAPYSVPAGDVWSWAKYGNYLFASNIADPLQVLDLGSGTDFVDASGSPPQAKYVFVVGEQLGLANIANLPNRVIVSAIGDASYWTVGQRGCDLQDFAEGEEIMGAIGSEKGAVLLHATVMRQAVLQPSGAYSFSTQIINPARGVAAPLSICSIGPGQFFYYSQDGFFLGAEGRPIGAERVDRWFSREIDPAKINEIRAVADPFEKVVWVQATRVDSTKFLLAYDWQLDRWGYANNNVSAMCVMVTPGLAWDDLDDLYPTMDDVDAPFDSSLFNGGLPRFAAFTTDNRLGFFTGNARAGTIETADNEFHEGFLTLMQEVRTVTDCTDFTIQVGTRQFHGDSIVWSNPVTPYAATRIAHFRKENPTGLTHRFRVNTAAGTDWHHMVGLSGILARPVGKR